MMASGHKLTSENYNTNLLSTLRDLRAKHVALDLTLISKVSVMVRSYLVMDQELSIAAFPHSFKECRTDMKVVRHCAPLQI